MNQKYVIIGIVVLVVLALPLLLKDRIGLDRIQLDQYKKISKGLDYFQVVEVLGRDGIPMDMTIEEAMKLKTVEGQLYGKHRGRTFKVYGWKNTSGNASGGEARCIVFFWNGKVVAKMQVGLK